MRHFLLALFLGIVFLPSQGMTATPLPPNTPTVKQPVKPPAPLVSLCVVAKNNYLAAKQKLSEKQAICKAFKKKIELGQTPNKNEQNLPAECGLMPPCDVVFDDEDNPDADPDDGRTLSPQDPRVSTSTSWNGIDLGPCVIPGANFLYVLRNNYDNAKDGVCSACNRWPSDLGGNQSCP